MNELKDYLKQNLKIKLYYKGDNTIEAALLLEGEEISKDFIHYRIK
jgi:hypothetical protein